MLEIGTKAPDFSLPDQNGKLHTLEEYKGKTIAYSLGNFVFGSSIPRTALLKVVWGGEGTQVSLIPCTSSKGFTRLSE